MTIRTRNIALHNSSIFLFVTLAGTEKDITGKQSQSNASVLIL